MNNYFVPFIQELDVMPGMHVADFGSGAGNAVFSLSQAVGKHGKVFALEVQKDMLDHMVSHAHDHPEINQENIFPVLANFELPNGSRLRDQSIDRIICAHTLFQTDNRQAVISEMARVMKPDGKVLVIEWKESFKGMGPQAHHVIPEAEMVRMLETYFIIRKINDPDAHSYVYMCHQK